MELQSITLGNFCVNKTAEVKPHENNLRFHFLIHGRYYEYAINSWNKTTINIKCCSKQRTQDACKGKARDER